MARVDIVVGLITEDNDFQRRQAEDARRTAEREKLSIEVLFASNNAIEQIQHCGGRVGLLGLEPFRLQ